MVTTTAFERKTNNSQPEKVRESTLDQQAQDLLESSFLFSSLWSVHYNDGSEGNKVNGEKLMSQNVENKKIDTEGKGLLPNRTGKMELTVKEADLALVREQERKNRLRQIANYIDSTIRLAERDALPRLQNLANQLLVEVKIAADAGVIKTNANYEKALQVLGEISKGASKLNVEKQRNIMLNTVTVLAGEQMTRRKSLGRTILGLGAVTAAMVPAVAYYSLDRADDQQANLSVSGEEFVDHYFGAKRVNRPEVDGSTATQEAEETESVQADPTAIEETAPEEVVLPDLSVNTGLWSRDAWRDSFVEGTEENEAALVVALNEKYPEIASLYGPAGYQSYANRAGEIFPGFNAFTLEATDDNGIIYAPGLGRTEAEDFTYAQQRISEKNPMSRSIIQSDDFRLGVSGLQFIMTDSTHERYNYDQSGIKGVYFEEDVMSKPGAQSDFSERLIERLGGNLKPGTRVIIHQTPLDLTTRDYDPGSRGKGRYYTVLDQFAGSWTLLPDQSTIILRVSISDTKFDEENELNGMLYGWGSSIHDFAILMTLAKAVDAQSGGDLAYWKETFGEDHPDGRLDKYMETKYTGEEKAYLFRGYSD